MRIKSDLRYELKYLIRRSQMDALLPELADYGSARTPHAGEHGRYPITSLYYDSPDHKAYWDKLEGHRNRRKVRVRVYGNEQVDTGYAGLRGSQGTRQHPHPQTPRRPALRRRHRF